VLTDEDHDRIARAILLYASRHRNRFPSLKLLEARKNESHLKDLVTALENGGSEFLNGVKMAAPEISLTGNDGAREINALMDELALEIISSMSSTAPY